MGIVILMSGFMLYQSKMLSALTHNWSLVTAVELERSNKLTKLERSLGYTGFIHHFKNYLLRRSDVYFDKAISSYIIAKENLTQLEKKSISEKEKENILVISKTINEYYENLQNAHKYWQNLSTEELDKRVKIDDLPAEKALNELRNFIEQEYAIQFESTRLKNEALEEKTLFTTLVLIPVMLVLSIVFYFFLKRFSKIFSENNVILEHSPDGIIYSDEQGNILQANQKARSLFEYTTDEFTRLTIEDLIPDRHRGQHIKTRKDFMKKEQHQAMTQRDTVIQGKTKSGTFVDLSIEIASIHVEGKKRAIAITRDITNINHLRKEASLDFLTNSYNRRSIDKYLNDEIERTKRYKRPLSLMIIDIDNFKHLNDKNGHLFGDQAIIQVAEFIKSTIRPSDKFGRWGGDEFLLICPELEGENAIAFAERIRSDFCQQTISKENNITLSIGIATYQSELNLTASQLVSNADSALYQSKKEGKNKVNIFK